MKITKDEVIKQLLVQLVCSPRDKDYQSHYNAAMYVLENFWQDKHDFIELEQESVDEFLSAFPTTTDLYDKLIEISKRKTEIRRIIDHEAEHTRVAGSVFQAHLKRFDDYLSRAAIICWADKQNYIAKSDLERLGYTPENINGLKEVFKYCPLIRDEEDRYTFVYPTIIDQCVKKGMLRDAYRDPGSNTDDQVQKDDNGKAYYPTPAPASAKPKPWDLPTATVLPVSRTNISASEEQGSDFRQVVPISSLFRPQPPMGNQLSAVDAATNFIALHKQKFQSDKAEFFIRKTEVKADWSLGQILQHAMSYDNRSRRVCEDLGWLNRDGTVKETAPDIVKGTSRTSSNRLG